MCIANWCQTVTDRGMVTVESLQILSDGLSNAEPDRHVQRVRPNRGPQKKAPQASSKFTWCSTTFSGLKMYVITPYILYALYCEIWTLQRYSHIYFLTENLCEGPKIFTEQGVIGLKSSLDPTLPSPTYNTVTTFRPNVTCSQRHRSVPK